MNNIVPNYGDVMSSQNEFVCNRTSRSSSGSMNTLVAAAPFLKFLESTLAVHGGLSSHAEDVKLTCSSCLAAR